MQDRSISTVVDRVVVGMVVGDGGNKITTMHAFCVRRYRLLLLLMFLGSFLFLAFFPPSLSLFLFFLFLRLLEESGERQREAAESTRNAIRWTKINWNNNVNKMRSLKKKKKKKKRRRSCIWDDFRLIGIHFMYVQKTPLRFSTFNFVCVCVLFFLFIAVMWQSGNDIPDCSLSRHRSRATKS